MRFAQAIAWVALWVSLGFAFSLGPAAYLALGVPLTIGFQRLVRKQPLFTLWVADAPRFTFDGVTAVLVAAFAVMPAIRLYRDLSEAQGWRALWAVAALLGSVGAAFATRRLTRKTTLDGLRCLASAGLLGVLLIVGISATRTLLLHQPFHPQPLHGLEQLLLFFPVTFVLEEVSFRGMIDAHVHRTSDRRGVLSAMLVSALWGLWHLPVAPRSAPLWVTAVQLIVVHTIVGVPLSLFWRRSQNLAVPAASHAFIDAVRDALIAAP